MRIAFYAPLKPPSHPVASGDRAVARLLIEALRRSGHEVEIASTFRSREGAGDLLRQERLSRLGTRLAERFLRRKTARGKRPDLWFTYHLYYKAPDWLGPAVAAALDIPYVVAEASIAEKRRVGPWALGHAAALAAVRRADAVIGLNSADRAGLVAHLASSDRWHALKPPVEVARFAAAARRRDTTRAQLARRHSLDPAAVWIAAVAMMRPGDKLASYRLLAAALARLACLPWRLLVIGDGPARPEVEAAFAPGAERVAWLGALAADEVAACVAACDLCAWPAVNEAYGIALLEAQAAGVPVVAGASGGVPDIVADGITGRLVPPGDCAAFARALGQLIAAPQQERRRLGERAALAAADHDVGCAATRLDAILRRVVSERSRR
ncbi:MAG TPA: glycosyltransferase family 4 protein [Stellaceae bacterium]|nr:glycosyltransferase family 4 protein [Stellaceae bacterium]